MDFSSKTVLITGGSRGIGRAAAVMFARYGAEVVFSYEKNHEEAMTTLDKMSSGKHKAIQASMEDPDQLKSMVDEIIEGYGKIDILINNAGVYDIHPFTSTSFDSWQRVWQRTIAINLTGVAHLCWLVGHNMIERCGGAIINVTSRGAFRGEPEAPAYGASKAAVNALSQSLAQALGRYNIAVIAIAPGFVETDMAEEILLSPKGDAIRGESPFNRVAEPEEVAHALCFAAQEKLKFLSGGIIDINGASFLRM